MFPFGVVCDYKPLAIDSTGREVGPASEWALVPTQPGRLYRVAPAFSLDSAQSDLRFDVEGGDPFIRLMRRLQTKDYVVVRAQNLMGDYVMEMRDVPRCVLRAVNPNDEVRVRRPSRDDMALVFQGTAAAARTFFILNEYD